MHVLIGSRALNFFFPNKVLISKSSDWDFLGPFLNNHQCDFLSLKEESSLIIYNEINSSKNKKIINSPIGPVIIAPLFFQKILKLSSLELKTIKHERDLNLLKNIKIPEKFLYLVDKRKNETSKRISNQKKDFFKNSVPRLFPHDELHFMIKNNPTYKKILDKGSSTLGSKINFNNLSEEDKLNLITEELFVFCIERNLIPQVLLNQTCLLQSIKSLNTLERTTSSPIIFWLDKFAVPNGVDRFPHYLSNFCKKKYDKILEHAHVNWENYLNNLPIYFWRTLLNQ